MSIHVSQMSEQQRLEWLKDYERRNPIKYLRKFGNIIGRDSTGQPSDWQYVAPEEAIKKVKTGFSSGKTLGVSVDVVEKEKVVVAKQFIDTPVSGVVGEAVVSEKPRRVRKTNV